MAVKTRSPSGSERMWLRWRRHAVRALQPVRRDRPAARYFSPRLCGGGRREQAATCLISDHNATLSSTVLASAKVKTPFQLGEIADSILHALSLASGARAVDATVNPHSDAVAHGKPALFRRRSTMAAAIWWRYSAACPPRHGARGLRPLHRTEAGTDNHAASESADDRGEQTKRITVIARLFCRAQVRSVEGDPVGFDAALTQP